MPQINLHINLNGNAGEAFTFYKSIFGGEFTKITRFKDLSGPEFQVSEKEADKIMHIALPVGKNALMANDVPESMGRTNENENRSKISISAESKEEASNYLTDFRQVDKLKCLLRKALCVLILVCVETNTVWNGWRLLTAGIKTG